MVKMKDMLGVVLIGGLIVLAGVFLGFYMRGGSLNTADETLDVAPITGLAISETDVGEDAVGKWQTKFVNYELVVSDKYLSTDVTTVTAKVYDELPLEWEDPRGDFDEPTQYTEYSVGTDNKTIVIDEEYPGHYYVVIEATGYNTEFLEIDITNGIGITAELSEYNDAPDSDAVKVSLVGATTDVDFAYTLVNETYEDTETINLKLDDDTELRGWKIVIEDVEGFSTDADKDEISDEGIQRFYVVVNGIELKVFDIDSGTDEFDNEDIAEFFVDVEDLTLADKEQLRIDVEIEAITLDSGVSANDEKWSEGEGVLAQITILDQEKNTFATVDVTA